MQDAAAGERENTLRVFRIHGEAEDLHIDALGAVTGAAGRVADEIEQRRPVISAVDCFVETADVGARVHRAIVAGVEEDAVEKTTRANTGVLPCVRRGGQQLPCFQMLNSQRTILQAILLAANAWRIVLEPTKI